jgi:chromosome segregation ATPase
MKDLPRTLERETEAAKALLHAVRSAIADDEQAVADAVEGETNLLEAIGQAVARIAELEAHGKGIALHITNMKTRQERLETRAENLRQAIINAMEACGLKKVERDIATLSLRPSPPKVIITSEADVPSAFWKEPDPVLDKRAILEALKANQAVSGAVLSNGSTSLSIRLK